MTKGFKYVDFTISSETTSNELAAFLLSTLSSPAPLSAEQSGLDSLPLSVSLDSRTKSNDTSRNLEHSVLVCVRGVHHASPSVLSTLMDVASYGQVRCCPSNGGPEATFAVPSVHLLLFCRQKEYGDILTEQFRSLFHFSLFASSLTVDRNVVLRRSTIRGSSIINKKNLLDVIAFPESLDTVSMCSDVSSYLRQLLLVLRGSSLPGSTTGVYLTRRYNICCQLIKAAALLFQPSPEAVSSHFITTARQRPKPNTQAAKTTRQNFSHVVVSCTDVICLLIPLVSHLFTIPRCQVQRVILPTNAAQPAPIARLAARAATEIFEHTGGSEDMGSTLLASIEPQPSCFLSYTEVREVVRHTVITYSSPAPG